MVDDSRPSWDATFMAHALDIAERANCMKNVQVGAVIIKNKRLIASGYNGAPPGEETCREAGECLIVEEMGSSCERVLHAEENAILQDSKECRDATLYITHFPCLKCMRQIASVGIKEVVYLKMYKPKHYKERYELARELADSAGIDLRELSREDRFAIIRTSYSRSDNLEELTIEEHNEAEESS